MESGAVVGEVVVEGEGLHRGLSLAGVGGDGDFEGSHVAVDAARLDLLLLVDDPVRLTGDAETGVVEDDNEGCLWVKVFGGFKDGQISPLDIL